MPKENEDEEILDVTELVARMEKLEKENLEIKKDGEKANIRITELEENLNALIDKIGGE